ncbi:hypothetical protein BDN72DRAFT_962297 [Pluteus cervinus]|uniref:Uncharacterized protein n=1 Tax=Pluteus cervinus TaxID=181527 RepID=A0ACD3AJC3_9AGAR|nr:hypothetical protein BDN72DRAFT_962297 [Pluteus cervinus]
MGLFSSSEHLNFGSLFKVAYHRHCSLLLSEAGSQQMLPGSKKADVNLIFQHPFLNLELLFDQVRKYGQPPSSEETQVLRCLVQECEEDIKALKSKSSDIISEISRLSRELSETGYRLSHRQKQVEFGQYLLQPQRNTAKLLPQDVLEEIFFAFCQSRLSPSAAFSKPQALRFAAVCHRWRGIALSTPRLWEHSYATSRHSSSLELAKARIEGCPSYVLRLYVQSKTQSLKDFLLFLQQSPAKLRRFELRVTMKCANEDIWDQVQKVDFGEVEEFVCQDNYTRIILPESAVQLKRLHLDNIPVSWKAAPPPSQLTILSITSGVHCSMLEHIFSHCLALQSILITITEHGPRSSSADDNVHFRTATLHQLETFCLINNFDQGELPSDLLHSFNFPRLSTFEYSSDKPSRVAIPWLTSLSFIHRIHRLSLSLHEDTTSLAPILRTTESLQEISILGDEPDLTTILGILSSLAQSSISPRLRGVQIVTHTRFENLTEHCSGFIEMVRALSNPDTGHRAALTHLRIGSWPKHGATTFLSRLQGGCRGVDVKIYDISSRWEFTFPEGFDMNVLPFGRVHERRALQADRSWKRLLGRVGIVESSQYI